MRRSISRSGRNRIFVNEQQVSLQQLQQITRGLLSISGQHEHQQLMDPDTHLATLDHFGGLLPLGVEVSRCFQRWSETRDQLAQFERLKREHAAQVEWMRFQLQELEAARLTPMKM